MAIPNPRYDSLKTTKLQSKTNKQLFEGIGEGPKADKIWSKLFWEESTFITAFPPRNFLIYVMWGS